MPSLLARVEWDYQDYSMARSVSSSFLFVLLIVSIVFAGFGVGRTWVAALPAGFLCLYWVTMTLLARRIRRGGNLVHPEIWTLRIPRRPTEVLSLLEGFLREAGVSFRSRSVGTPGIDLEALDHFLLELEGETHLAVAAITGGWRGRLETILTITVRRNDQFSRAEQIRWALAKAFEPLFLSMP